MIIKSLETISLSEITKTFNEAFADYVIQFTATEEYLQTRWKGAGVDYKLSYGGFENDTLVGFIIHGIDNWNGLKTAFNVGTGVIPEYRGKRMVKNIYDYAIPKLKKHGIQQCLLEVIQENERAIRAYHRIGFKEGRELISLTYTSEANQVEHGVNTQIQFEIEENIRHVNWDIIQTFWDFYPSWENSISALIRSAEIYHYLGMLKDKRLIGYVIFNPKTGYIPQFGVAKGERGKDYARNLFNKLATLNNRFSIINVEKQANQTLKFLTTYGFKKFISQYEMKKILE
ncbi:MAG: GNAT family N-acetyltransferase [Promethearchaeota archaeon]